MPRRVWLAGLSIWPGLATNPCPYYPEGTPALCYGATTGGTPWRFNLHVADTGHTTIEGPTGAGKSVALGIIVANARAPSQICRFSSWTKATRLLC